MAKFEVVSKYADADIPLPVRATANSAGYDFIVAEDIIVPNWANNIIKMVTATDEDSPAREKTLEEMAALTKLASAKPTLVPTGIKCQLDEGTYLELSVRSSTPLKHWLVLANS